MKYFLGIMFAIPIILGACSAISEESTRYPKDLLADEKGKYSFLVVHPDDGFNS